MLIGLLVEGWSRSRGMDRLDLVREVRLVFVSAEVLGSSIDPTETEERLGPLHAYW